MNFCFLKKTVDKYIVGEKCELIMSTSESDLEFESADEDQKNEQGDISDLDIDEILNEDEAKPAVTSVSSNDTGQEPSASSKEQAKEDNKPDESLKSETNVDEIEPIVQQLKLDDEPKSAENSNKTEENVEVNKEIECSKFVYFHFNGLIGLKSFIYRKLFKMFKVKMLMLLKLLPVGTIPILAILTMMRSQLHWQKNPNRKNKLTRNQKKRRNLKKSNQISQMSQDLNQAGMSLDSVI